jgi:hypothetical protein
MHLPNNVEYTDEYLHGKLVYLKEVNKTEICGFIIDAFSGEMDINIVMPSHLKGCFINVVATNLEYFALFSKHKIQPNIEDDNSF